MKINGNAIMLIVCDLAGTCVDYGSLAPVEAFIELFRRNRIAATEAEARAPMGKHKRDHIRQMLDMPAIAAQWQSAYCREWTEKDLDSLFAQFLPLQMEIIPTYSTVIPGVVDTIRAWQASGMKVACTTGYNREMTAIVLAEAEKQGLVFDASSCASEVPAGRPAPWMIYRCMEATGVGSIAQVVNVGDTIADIASGINAGAWTVGVAMSGNMLGLRMEDALALTSAEYQDRRAAAFAAMHQAGAHLVVDSLADLLPMNHELSMAGVLSR